MEQDKVIICKDCGREFTFSVGEQRFYAEKGLKAPVRCKECKNKRKGVNTNETPVVKKTEKKETFEEMFERWKANTILFEGEIERRNKKKKR